MKVLLGERRKTPRVSLGGIQGVEVVTQDWPPRVLPAKVHDASATGFGLEMAAPLPTGSLVLIASKLGAPDLRLEVKAQARVVYCQQLENGLYRVGISTENLPSQKLLLPSGQRVVAS